MKSVIDKILCASCGHVKEVHHGTWTDGNLTKNSQITTINQKEKASKIKKGGKIYNEKHQKMMFDCIMVVK